MLNLIKMDFYRLFHSKVGKIGLIVVIASALLLTLGNYGVYSILKLVFENENGATGGYTPQDYADMATIFPTILWNLYGVNGTDVVFHLTNALSLFIACMLSAIFVSAEQTSGYVKNIAGQVRYKGYTVGSKLVVTSFIHFVVLAIYTIIALLLAPALFNECITGWNIPVLIGGLLLRLVIFFAINSLIVFLCLTFKSQSFSMVCGAILGIGALQLVYLAIGALVNVVKEGLNFEPGKYMPDGINGMISIAQIDNIWVQGLIVSILFIVGFSSAAIYIVSKRDVK